jgi:hypothetical protein
MVSTMEGINVQQHIDCLVLHEYLNLLLSGTNPPLRGYSDILMVSSRTPLCAHTPVIERLR